MFLAALFAVQLNFPYPQIFYPPAIQCWGSVTFGADPDPHL
jgi:hypothetical protein